MHQLHATSLVETQILRCHAQVNSGLNIYYARLLLFVIDNEQKLASESPDTVACMLLSYPIPRRVHRDGVACQSQDLLPFQNHLVDNRT